MAKDIEEFLKMAAQRRAEQKRKEAAAGGQQPAHAPPPPVPLTPPPASAAAPLSPPSGHRAPPVQQQGATPKKKPKQPKATPKATGNIRPTIDTNRLVQQTARLGQEVGLADDKMDAHIQDVFAHDVATLGASSSLLEPTARTRRPTLAAELRKMLTSPQSVRQAVILAEILRRPEFDDEPPATRP